MSLTTPPTSSPAPSSKGQLQRQGIQLLVGIVALMWLIEIINSLDSNGLDGDGIYPRNLGRLWGIITAPFLHASFQHLIDNTIPLVFLGLLIALRGARRLALVTLIVIVVGGLGTWLISSSGSYTFGASGVVFGYLGYRELGISQFFLVQWVAPLASEAPEFLVAALLKVINAPTLRP